MDIDLSLIIIIVSVVIIMIRRFNIFIKVIDIIFSLLFIESKIEKNRGWY